MQYSALDDMWFEKPEVIRAFLEAQPAYERMAQEVSYAVEAAIRAAGVEAQFSHRAKTLPSFCEKVMRKSYAKPMEEVTDIAGVRVTFLYLSDRPKIEAVIEKEFEVVEKVDKVDLAKPEAFGYGALHYLVKLGKKASGARYDHLQNMVCEIQVRTVLQDAWSIIGHHLSYKKESDVPEKLRRRLNALSALFEIADDQFQQLRDQRQAYAATVKKQIIEKKPSFLKTNINLENLIEYLNWRFPDRGPTSRPDAVLLLSDLINLDIKDFGPLESAIEASYEAVKAYEKKYPPVNMETNEPGLFGPVGVVRTALTYVGKLTPWVYEVETRMEEFRHLVKPKA